MKKSFFTDSVSTILQLVVVLEVVLVPRVSMYAHRQVMVKCDVRR